MMRKDLEHLFAELWDELDHKEELIELLVGNYYIAYNGAAGHAETSKGQRLAHGQLFVLNNDNQECLALCSTTDILPLTDCREMIFTVRRELKKLKKEKEKKK